MSASTNYDFRVTTSNSATANIWVDKNTQNSGSACQSCGNSVREGTEQCDAGPTGGGCCTASCTYVSAGTSCRGSAGLCDVAETCSGSSAACPADGYLGGGTSCRGSAGLCDVAEVCSGSSAACPADGYLGGGTSCRAAIAGGCDIAETCSGSSAACPADTVSSSSTLCRASLGICDRPDFCTGSSNSCPSDAKNVSTTVCRAPAGVCDTQDFCDGTNNNCPADLKSSSATVCRAAIVPCGLSENCDGASNNCPADLNLTSSSQCRGPAGLCDAAEFCPGTSYNCPTDLYSPAGTVCNPTSNPLCDPAETCSGAVITCPADTNNCVSCNWNTFCDGSETCSTCPSDCGVCQCDLSTLAFNINPSDSYPGAGVNPGIQVSGLNAANCDGKSVVIKKMPLGVCASNPVVASCTVSGGACSAVFNAPMILGNLSYRAFLDVDVNGSTCDAVDDSFKEDQLIVKNLSVIYYCDSLNNKKANLSWVANGSTPYKVSYSAGVSPYDELGTTSNAYYNILPSAGSLIPNTDYNWRLNGSTMGVWVQALTQNSGASCTTINGVCEVGETPITAPQDCCTGNIALALTPSSVTASGSTIPSASGLNVECAKTIEFRNGTCSGPLLRSCPSLNGGCAAASFGVTDVPGSYPYSACIDKDNSNGFNDAGESDIKSLTVTPPCSGVVSLSINVTETTNRSDINVSVTGLSNCDGRPVIFRNGSCSGGFVSPNSGIQSFCVLSGGKCWKKMTAPGSESVTNIVACIDINDDTVYQSNEYDSKSLIVNVCTGPMWLFWQPTDVVEVGTLVTPVVGFLENCAGKTAFFDDDIYCTSPFDSCTVDSWGCGGLPFAAPSPAGMYPYYTCVNKNAAVNSNMADAGEWVRHDLTTTPLPCSQTTENCDFECPGNVGDPCQCTGECVSRYCTPDTNVCAGCTSNLDCSSPPNSCTEGQGTCSSGTCFYLPKNPLPAECSGPPPASDCNRNQPLDNCGGDLCPACIVGYVEAYTGIKLQSAVVNYQPGDVDAKTTSTDSAGLYTFYDIIPIPPWLRDPTPKSLQANPPSGSLLTPSSPPPFTIHQAINYINLVLGKGSSDCLPDCTQRGQPFCVASCEGTNGCQFSSDIAAEVCDGATKDFVRNISDVAEVVCCRGNPSTIYNIQSVASVPEATDVFTITKSVFYAGRLVKLKIVVFK